jgi:hypothetical protein
MHRDPSPASTRALFFGLVLGLSACGSDPDTTGPESDGGVGAGGRADGGRTDGAVRPGSGGGGRDGGKPPIMLPPGSCGGESYEAEARQLDLYMMVDESGSMIPWWGPVTNALRTFISAPEAAGIGVGMQFFGESCDVDTYATPRVPIASLPDNAAALNGSFAAIPLAGTPTLPALQGAIKHARAWATSHPDSKVAVVLVTDGLPDECNSNVDTVASAAAEGFEGTPSIPTYVVGLPLLEPLNPIAVAGGTGQAYAADPTNTQALIDVMNKVRGEALPCEYALPAGADDPALVNLDYLIDGATKQIPKVLDVDKCEGEAWYYDDNDSPKRLVACPATCQTFKQTGGAVNVVIGCPTVVLL